MKRFSWAGLVAAAILSCSPVLAQTVTVDSARGAVEVAVRPETVAVFDIAALDTIHALGITPAGVPDKLYVPYLADLAGAAKPVGTLFEPDLEALAALGPDLIVLGGRSSTRFDAVSALAPTLDMTIWEDLVAEARARIGAYGAIFDGAEDRLKLSDAVLFEMEEIMARPKAAAPALLHLFDRLEERFDGRPTLLVLDEAWLFLDSPLFAARIREWLKTLRKKNVAVVFATQSLADVADSAIAPL